VILLKMMAIGSARIKANSFRIRFGILSGPVALWIWSAQSLLQTSSNIDYFLPLGCDSLLN
jgi:hypothetical protein